MVDISKGSPDRFGYEWGAYSEILPDYEEQFRRWTPHFSIDSWQGKTFLDVGCGMGRNSYWPMTYGAKRGVAIDVDDRSLEAATRNLERFSEMEVRQQSAYDIEEEDVFDIAFSIGVIHHLEHPETALTAMVKSIKPGGTVAIWVYGLENNRWIIYTLTPLRKLLFSWMPIGIVHFLSLFPTTLLWLFLKVGLGRIEYFSMIRNFSFAHLRAMVFDQLLPNIAHYWPEETVCALMRDAGLLGIDLIWVNEMSWAAIGIKPNKEG
jgi:SAM-dependent methyltransferase